MKDQGKIQFNPEHTWLFSPQKWGCGGGAEAWVGIDSLEDRRWWALEWWIQMVPRTSLPTTTSVLFLRDRFCVQSYNRGKASFWRRKTIWARDLAKHYWRLRQQLDKYFMTLSHQMLLVARKTATVLFLHDPDTKVVFGPQLLITLWLYLV